MLIHLVTTTDNVVDTDAELASYLEAMTHYCVSLRGALPAGDLHTSIYAATPDTSLDALHRDLFTAAVAAGETLREVARTGGSRLTAHVLAVRDAPFRHRDVLDIPHWLTKLLYARYGVMVGKYGAHETMSEPYLPTPNIPFLALRRGVPNYDREFLAKTPELAAQLDDPRDDGESPFVHVPGCDGMPADQAQDAFLAVRQWAMARVPSEPVRVLRPLPSQARRAQRR